MTDTRRCEGCGATFTPVPAWRGSCDACWARFVRDIRIVVNEFRVPDADELEDGVDVEEPEELEDEEEEESR